jgi:fengycin family lipopeptide synthetase D
MSRQALPAPIEARGATEMENAVVPRVATEVALAALWAQVLDRNHVSINDNFFDVGGDSLGAVRMAARIRAVFGCELPIRDLFAHPTVSGLAGRIEILSRGATDASQNAYFWGQ